MIDTLDPFIREQPKITLQIGKDGNNKITLYLTTNAGQQEIALDELEEGTAIEFSAPLSQQEILEALIN